MRGFSNENISFPEVIVGFVDLQAVKTTHMAEGGGSGSSPSHDNLCIAP